MMKSHRSVAGVLFAAAILLSAFTIEAQSIRSQTEPGEELAVQHVAPATGFATFASSPGRGILLSLPDNAPAEERARSFVAIYGKPFGLNDPSQLRLMREPKRDELGMEHVRFQQVHKGVPIRAAEFIVHMKGARVTAANGHAIADLPDDVTPQITAEAARTIAQQVVQKQRADLATHARFSAPSLEILNRSLLSDKGTHRSQLAWFIEATALDFREFIWIDARTGWLLLHFSQLPHAKSREVYTANHTATLPGTLMRSEGGGASGDTDIDNAYSYSGATYDYYYNNYFRDSYDDFGSTIVSTTHYCPPSSCPSYSNAFWNGSQMVYGDGFASADDVVGHELTHAVTEYTANLIYYNQSGALNESLSDIFGETIDLTDGLGTDTSGVRWQIGEDLPIGAIRDMLNPTSMGDPGKMSDSAYFVCSDSAWTDTSDNGGVHTNSGIPNHAFALMVDGGTYNGKTITGIGLTKAGNIEYVALLNYLTSGANFIDAYNALNQSCADLTGFYGITSSNCTQVMNALLAVEMNATWPCSGATAAPAMCPSGLPSYFAYDDFEFSEGNWSYIDDYGAWWLAYGFAKRGIWAEWGKDVNNISDHMIVMTNGLTIPAGARMYFDHAFEFENGAVTAYDGGVLEYSTNGTTWNDAGGLFDAGQAYNGALDLRYRNPLASRSAFAFSSYGYTATRLNLSTLAGQTVKFRFRVGTDESLSSLGWLVDNIGFYTCIPTTYTDNPLVALSTKIKTAHIIELRAHIDALRIGRGLSPYPWTDRVLTPAAKIKALHIEEMRNALGIVYSFANTPSPTYTDPALAANDKVKSIHITELRSAVAAVE